jgi:hypothetical protein
MVPMIFLNLFIAIILEGFEQTSTKVNNLIQEEDLERFRECWAEFDKDVSHCKCFLNKRFVYRQLVSLEYKICPS